MHLIKEVSLPVLFQGINFNEYNKRTRNSLIYFMIVAFVTKFQVSLSHITNQLYHFIYYSYKKRLNGKNNDSSSSYHSL